MGSPTDVTFDTLIERALTAYATLAELGEEVDEEWSYIQDLTGTWRGVFEAARVARRSEVMSDETVDAVETAIDEVGRIQDPHRAIDWLSTFPQVTLIALGERP